MQEAAPSNLTLGSVAPDFEQQSTHGLIKFHEWCDNSWVILFSHPADYTPVCTTQLAEVARLQNNEFKDRNTKVIALSVDSVEDHKGWTADIQHFGKGGFELTYPILADGDRKVAKLYNMLPAQVAPGVAMSVRSVFIIGPDKKIKLTLTYPASTGRNFVEILRVLDSLQLTANKSLATPVNWKMGDKCVIASSIKDDDAEKKFPGFETVELPSKKRYLRLTDKYKD